MRLFPTFALAALFAAGSAAAAPPSERVEVRAVLAAYNDVLAADPRLAKARTLVASQPAQAVEALQAYLQRQPKGGEAWYLLGVAHARLADDEAAAEAFVRAVSHKPALRILLEEAKRRDVGSARSAIILLERNRR